MNSLSQQCSHCQYMNISPIFLPQWKKQKTCFHIPKYIPHVCISWLSLTVSVTWGVNYFKCSLILSSQVLVKWTFKWSPKLREKRLLFLSFMYYIFSVTLIHLEHAVSASSLFIDTNLLRGKSCIWFIFIFTASSRMVCIC